MLDISKQLLSMNIINQEQLDILLFLSIVNEQMNKAIKEAVSQMSKAMTTSIREPASQMTISTRKQDAIKT